MIINKEFSGVSTLVEIFETDRVPKVDIDIVTISILAYNSEKYIKETLESIKSQTYPNILLQISDDKSVDTTIEVCRKWIIENKERFLKCKIIQPERNTGVSANCNRAWDECETIYFKGIAGDDILMSNCIEDNINYIKEHRDAVVLFSRAQTFRVVWGKKWKQGYRHRYDFFDKSMDEQYRMLIEVGNVLPASSVFVNIKKLRELHIRHDERIPLLEDYPKWIQMLRKKIKFHYLDKDTVLYRLNDNSLSIGLFSPIYYKSNLLFYLYYFLDEIKDPQDQDHIFNIISDHETKFYSWAYNAAVSSNNSLWNKTIVRLYRNTRTILRAIYNQYKHKI